MRKFGFLVTTCLIFSITTSMALTLPQKFIVDPGVVRLYTQTVGLDSPVQIHGPGIIGSVTLIESRFGSDEDSANTGGGCLVYLPPNARKCTKDSGCTIRFVEHNADGSTAPTSIARDGYCAYTTDIPERIMSGQAEKRCWYKPEPEACGRCKGDNNCPRLEPNQELKTSPTDIHPPGITGRIYWRVVSCQNLKAKGCNHLTIQDGHVYKYGPIRGFD
jgi:hypothetical protein